MHVLRLRTLLVGRLLLGNFLFGPLFAGALCLPVSANAAGVAASAPPTLAHLVELAWARSTAGRSAPARSAEAHAARALSASWVAGQPVLGLSQRDGRAGGQGTREAEVSLAASVWSPAQRDARRVLADQTGRELDAHDRAARLAVAGDVRTRVWDAAAAQALLDEKLGHLHHAQDLAEEVQRRVAAGDLARVDGLLVEQEVHAGRVAVDMARAELDASRARLALLTGHAGPVPDTPEPLAPGPVADHPGIGAARAAQQRAQAALQLVQRSRSAPPTVTVSVRRERDVAMVVPERSLGVAVQIPIGTAGRNRPAEAQAQAGIDMAAAQLAQNESAAQLELEAAGSALVHTRAALVSARARVAAMGEHRRLIERAFRLGERGLAELLRSTALAHEAEVAERQQAIALARAHAQYNQAAGVMP